MSSPQEERQRHMKRLTALKNERSSWDPHWRDLSDYIQPRRSRFFRTDATTPGIKKHQHIINGSPTWSLRTLASGMMAGITSPARPWFRLTTQDTQLAKNGAVKQWLHVAEQGVLDVLAKSNVYNALHGLYGDISLIGTSCLVVEEDPKQVLRAYLVPVGEYCLAASDRGDVDTLYRETTLSVGNLVRKFGLEACSQRVRDSYERNEVDRLIDVVHVVEPREAYNPDRLDPKNMPVASCWFERDGDSDAGMLKESGYREMPALCPRWGVTGSEVYGSSPGMDALGDAKALQLYERNKGTAVELIVNPPMVGPGELRTRPVSMLPGAVTYVDHVTPGMEFKPLVVIPPEVVKIAEASIREHELRIQKAFFADLWLMLAQDAGPQMTAREVAERHQEKMLQLGPVMERLENELLGPLIHRTFGILMRSRRLPPPPASLTGQGYNVEYLSIMSQAQKMIAGSGIQQFAGFVGSLSAISPDAVDKIDCDEVVDQYGDALAVNPSLIRSADEVAQIRAARAKQQAQQAQAAQAMAAAQGAKTLSQADTSGDNALTRTLGAVAGAQAEGEE